MKPKFIKKYMRIAKAVADDNNSCYARKIGTIIVKSFANGDSNIVSAGYNGPPKRTPHCDNREYLEKMVWPELTMQEKLTFISKFPHDPSFENAPDNPVEYALDKAENCKVCPRRLVGAPSGVRLELCVCEHSERNSIYNAGCDLHDCIMFCWCGIPCLDCAKAIINSGITQIYCIKDSSYGTAYNFHRSEFLFEKAGVKVFLAPPEYYLENDE